MRAVECPCGGTDADGCPSRWEERLGRGSCQGRDGALRPLGIRRPVGWVLGTGVACRSAGCVQQCFIVGCLTWGWSQCLGAGAGRAAGVGRDSSPRLPAVLWGALYVGCSERVGVPVPGVLSQRWKMEGEASFALGLSPWTCRRGLCNRPAWIVPSRDSCLGRHVLPVVPGRHCS